MKENYLRIIFLSCFVIIVASFVFIAFNPKSFGKAVEPVLQTEPVIETDSG